MTQAITLSPAMLAMRRRARMGLLLVAAGCSGMEFEFWRGYIRALRELATGTGDKLAEKDARLPYQPLGGFEAAALCLDQDIELLSRVEIQDLLAKAGIEISPQALPHLQVEASQQLEDSEVAAVAQAHGEHAALRVVESDQGLHPEQSTEAGQPPG